MRQEAWSGNCVFSRAKKQHATRLEKPGGGNQLLSTTEKKLDSNPVRSHQGKERGVEPQRGIFKNRVKKKLGGKTNRYPGAPTVGGGLCETDGGEGGWVMVGRGRFGTCQKQGAGIQRPPKEDRVIRKKDIRVNRRPLAKTANELR